MATKKTAKAELDTGVTAKAEKNKDQKNKDQKERMSFKVVLYPLIGIAIVVIALSVYLSATPSGNHVTPLSNVTVTNNQSASLMFERCAQLVNLEYIKSAVSDHYNGSTRDTFVLTPPRNLTCTADNGTSITSSYSIEIEDGFVKTTINGHSAINNFTKGIVIKGITIPTEDIAKGIFLYVERPRQGNLGYSYELRNNSVITFDAYDPQLLSDYKIRVYKNVPVPTVVWNCKQAYAQRPDMPNIQIRNPKTGNLTQPLPESVLLKTLTCAFNNGQPPSACPHFATVNGSVTLPPEAALHLYLTNSSSCNPGNNTIKVQAFYAPDCANCTKQRAILEELKSQFGSNMDLKYYCVGTASDCLKYVQARAA